MFSDAAKLMNQRSAAQNGVIVHFHFPGQLRSVSQDDMVFQNAVVGSMGIGHQQTIVSDDGFPLGSRTAIHGCTFADSGVIADFTGRFFSLEFQILGNTCYDGSRKYPAVFSNARPFKDNGMRINTGIIANNGILIDECESADCNILSDNCFRMN
jgi:hypothetical protein